MIRNAPAATIAADQTGTTIRGLLVPYEQTTDVSDGGPMYRERFAAGSVIADPRGVFVYAGHAIEPDGTVTRGELIGRAVNGSHDPDGYRADLIFADTAAGRDTLALYRAGVADGLSVEFHDLENATATDGTITRVRALLTGVAVVPVPAYTAAGLARTDPQEIPNSFTTEEPAMTVTDPDTIPDPDPVVPDDDTARARAAARSLGVAPTVPAARYRSFGHYAHARAAGTDDGTLARAWTDLVTGDVPGITRDAWISEVIDLMAVLTPTVQAFRRRPLPDSGMNVTQPRVKTRPTVGKQTAQKTAITSTKAEIELASWPVETFAGGNDVSIQAIRRTDPDALNELMRLYSEELAKALNAHAAGLLIAGATVNNAVQVTAAEPHKAFTAAAKAILTHLRRMPNVAVLGVDLWETLANAVDANKRPLFPALNPSNPVGSVSLTDTDGQVMNLRYYVDPDLPPADGIVGVSDAFVTALGGVDTLSVDVPRLLGRDVAVFQFAAAGVTDAAGLVRITTGTVPAPNANP